MNKKSVPLLVVGITVTEVMRIQTAVLQTTGTLMASRQGPTPEGLDLTWSWTSHPPAERYTFWKTYTTFILVGLTVTQKLTELLHERTQVWLNTQHLEHNCYTNDFLFNLTVLKSGLSSVVSYPVGQYTPSMREPLKAKKMFYPKDKKTDVCLCKIHLSAHWRLTKLLFTWMKWCKL